MHRYFGVSICDSEISEHTSVTSYLASFRNELGRGTDSKGRLDMIHNVSDSYDLRISYEFHGPRGEFDAALEYWNDEHNLTFPDIF